MKQKKIIIITSIIVIFLIVVFLIIGIIIANNNNSVKQKGVEVVIYQYHVYNYKFDTTKSRVEIYRAFFNDELEYDKIIYALDNNSGYNHVVIKDGIVKVTEASCTNHTCQHHNITNKSDSLSLLDSMLDISCYPNGLFIVLEEIK